MKKLLLFPAMILASSLPSTSLRANPSAVRMEIGQLHQNQREVHDKLQGIADICAVVQQLHNAMLNRLQAIEEKFAALEKKLAAVNTDDLQSKIADVQSWITNLEEYVKSLQ